MKMNKEMQQKLMYSPEFRDAMDQYLNGLTHQEMYDTLYSFWFDYLLEKQDIEFIRQFIKTKEL
jgi:hypothetical protein